MGDAVLEVLHPVSFAQLQLRARARRGFVRELGTSRTSGTPHVPPFGACEGREVEWRTDVMTSLDAALKLLSGAVLDAAREIAQGAAHVPVQGLGFKSIVSDPCTTRRAP